MSVLWCPHWTIHALHDPTAAECLNCMSLTASLLCLSCYPCNCDQKERSERLKPVLALMFGHIQTLQIANLQTLFFPFKLPALRKLLLKTLHSRNSRDDAKKSKTKQQQQQQTVWWNLMSYAIKSVWGMLIIVCFCFVCLFSYSHSFSPCLSLNGKWRFLIWGLLQTL